MSETLMVEPPPFESPPFPATMLEGQVAFVTGGGSCMGLGVARALAQAGAAIAVVGRSLESAREGVRAITANGGTAQAVVADVRDATQVAAAFDAAEALLGPVSILANNAGGNFPVLAEKMSSNAWKAITQITIDGTFLCSAEFARRRIAAALGGVIVNNSAQYIWTGFPGDAHSAAAKVAVAGMTRAMARDWAGHGIRVNCVAAGFFPHAGSSAAAQLEAMPQLDAMIPAGRMREFGWISTFLCSPLAAGITGEIVMIDGAENLRRALLSPEFVPSRERAEIWGTRHERKVANRPHGAGCCGCKRGAL